MRADDGNEVSTELAVVSTAGGTLGVALEPLQHVLQVTAVGAALAPGVHAADGDVANGTVGRFHGALLTYGAHLDSLMALGAVHLNRG